MSQAPDDLQLELFRAGFAIAARRHVRLLFWCSDLPPPAAALRRAGKKLVQVVSSPALFEELEEEGRPVVLIPGYEMGRQDRFRLGLLGALARAYVKAGDAVAALVALRPRSQPDTLLVHRADGGAMPIGLPPSGDGVVSAGVFDAIVELAIELGVEGWEGHALGTLFVVGDSARIMEGSRQVALNPFQGYSESQRNLSDPAVREALRNFATLEGAFVVREDGVVLAAGRYLQLEPRPDVQLPLGLGARHMAAAFATAATDAIAVVVSQTNGKVRVFRKGRVVLELAPGRRRT